mgnify:FL=1
MHRPARLLRSIATLVLLLALAACASAPPPSPTGRRLAVPPDQYAAAFGAAKDVLRAHGFALARVDARAGVLTTQPRHAAGLATPWIPHSTTLSDAAAGVLHRDRRTAEVRFRPAAGGPTPDLRDDPPELVAEVVVTVERVFVPGRRPDPTSIRLTAISPDTTPRISSTPGRAPGPAPAAATLRSTDAPDLIVQPVRRDTELAREIAARLRDALAEAQTTQING